MKLTLLIAATAIALSANAVPHAHAAATLSMLDDLQRDYNQEKRLYEQQTAKCNLDGARHIDEHTPSGMSPDETYKSAVTTMIQRTTWCMQAAGYPDVTGDFIGELDRRVVEKWRTSRSADDAEWAAQHVKDTWK